jgi:SAM-dependent methyltransferase
MITVRRASPTYSRSMPESARFWEDAATVGRYSALGDLFPEEQRLAERLRDELAGMRMLDVGVGAGRTTAHFAPLVREYLGVDASSAMIAACRRRFAEERWSHARFEIADVRSMIGVASESFELVLFSYNGLDYMLEGGHERLLALQEIRRVCAPGALFAFSAHNLNSGLDELSYRARLARARGGASRPSEVPLRIARALVRVSAMRLLNGGPRRHAAARRAALYDYRHGVRPMRTMYLRPAEQLRELAAAGFDDPCVLTAAGDELRGARAVDGLRDEWLHYLARAPR